MIQHLSFRVTSLLNEVAKLKDEALQYARNKDNPFALRWDAFKQFARLGGKESGWGYDGWNDLPIFPRKNWKDEVVNELSWYDDFNVERYQTFDLLETGLERILDRFSFDENWEDTKMSRMWGAYNDAEPNPLHAIDWALTVYKEPVLIQAVEALIRDGVTRFTYDW